MCSSSFELPSNLQAKAYSNDLPPLAADKRCLVVQSGFFYCPRRPCLPKGRKACQSGFAAFPWFVVKIISLNGSRALELFCTQMYPRLLKCLVTLHVSDWLMNWTEASDKWLQISLGDFETGIYSFVFRRRG
ncbi:hypothetical protein AVEN_217737-1 [Araneus ventricosus]|uniref:Uncharacterized protein n=1 Tax=Araneus ventricosus TaxID=182803 RepID=A0A4Y1ZRW2_ARAVE|nr:hypothetical protein AVEN_217737-1 [Araneus ventricosus]